MAKILVTGAAGFIGAHVSRELIARGDDVIAVDDFNDRYPPELKRKRYEALVGDEAKLIEADIADTEKVEQIVSEEKPDIICHLGAWAAVPMSIDKPDVYARANVLGTVNMLEAARKNNVKNFVFASSSSVYGGRKEVPFSEDEDITKTISPYAATKAAGEIMCRTWNHLYQLPVTALRFFTVYGPWGRPEMAYWFFASKIAKGEPIEMRGEKTARDFTYIDDIVAGVIAAIDKPQPFAVYNLGNNQPVELPKFIATIEKAMDKKAEIKLVDLIPGDVPITCANIDKAKKDLGYNPTTSIDDGIKKFIDWFSSDENPLQ